MIQHQSKKCLGILGFVFGHNFQPRFTENYQVEEGLPVGRCRCKFVSYDICIRCGTIVEVPPQDNDDEDDADELPLPLPVSDGLKTQ